MDEAMGRFGGWAAILRTAWREVAGLWGFWVDGYGGRVYARGVELHAKADLHLGCPRSSAPRS